MALCFSLSPTNSLVHFSQGSSSESTTLFTQTSSFHKLPGKVYGQSFPTSVNSLSSRKSFNILPRCSGTSPPEGGTDESKDSGTAKVPFGYSRKDVLLIGVGVTLLGIGLKSGLEFVGVDPLQAGNVVQLVLVLGLTIGWISTYIFRVSNKEMTYATQLRQYESKVMEKRLEGLTEAELEVLLEQVEEEKQSLASGKKEFLFKWESSFLHKLKDMLYVIGLGLGDEKDITVKGLEAVKKCDKVYIEAYTSLLSFGISSSGISTLEEFYGKPVIVADREMVEERADNMLLESRTSNVAFLVVGDPFGATTHTDLVVRAKKEGIEVKVIHNASVMNAVGVCGLQLYRYGETVSIPFFTDTWRPDSFYEKIKRNRSLELHTLCLLDIRVKEPSMESLARGRKVYEAPKYMKISTAIEQLLEVEENRGESVYDENSICVGLARIGCEDQKVVAGTMKELAEIDFGEPLHCLVIVGKTHHVEEEMLEFYSLKKMRK